MTVSHLLNEINCHLNVRQHQMPAKITPQAIWGGGVLLLFSDALGLLLIRRRQAMSHEYYIYRTAALVPGIQN